MDIDEIIIYSVLLGSVFVFGGVAVLALSWAVRNGQFENLERGSRSIFDPGEPIGEMTDRFPDAAEQNVYCSRQSTSRFSPPCPPPAKPGGG